MAEGELLNPEALECLGPDNLNSLATNNFCFHIIKIDVILSICEIKMGSN